MFRYYKDDYILLFDGNKNNPSPISLYNLREDILMKENILNNCDVQNEMVQEIMAIIQQYMNRMVYDRLTIETDNKVTED